MNLVRVGVGARLDVDIAPGQKDKVEGVIAGSTEPVMLDETLVGFAANDADDATISQVTQFSFAGGVETFVDHGPIPHKCLAAFGCGRRRVSSQRIGESCGAAGRVRYLRCAARQMILCRR